MGWSKLDVSTSDWDGLTSSYPALWRAAAQKCNDRLSAGAGADEAPRIRSYEKYGQRWLQLLAR
jgi:hypothetical protein